MNDKVFKAISDKTRRRILTLLKKQDLTAGQIAEHFDMSKPSISEHLKILRNADLIGSEKKGQFIKYFLNTSVVEGLLAYLMEFLGDQNQNEE
ncbi:MAG: transcriptional regulator [Candidatus Wallbacteria bacterium HGW-Wallbacteria-1]|uniref:Transcriptional regulator n=1 Tax=Candidatus Wallbacteria bacterium HGW-Wallbacteria-1 TaxID=2013854 RepID=A0A2N1PN44_9BACT|nr:MAG: transcriptional regulator [Candidatus Wallbacteria bacterium HGW-Wallbacteria-1]